MGNGKIKKKVAPGKYVWVEKGKHGANVHPDDVAEYVANGYTRVGKKPQAKTAAK